MAKRVFKSFVLAMIGAVAIAILAAPSGGVKLLVPVTSTKADPLQTAELGQLLERSRQRSGRPPSQAPPLLCDRRPCQVPDVKDRVKYPPEGCRMLVQAYGSLPECPMSGTPPEAGPIPIPTPPRPGPPADPRPPLKREIPANPITFSPR